MPSDPYVIAGVNVRAFVLDWLTNLENGGGEMRGLLDVDVDEQGLPDHDLAARMMMSSIARQVISADASAESLLFFAVMAVYQGAEYPGANKKSWAGFRVHVERAFDYFQSMSETQAAGRL